MPLLEILSKNMLIKYFYYSKSRLLLFDGHKTHLTIEFLEYYVHANIIPFKFTAHATHLL